MSYFVYVLQSRTTGRFYVGHCQDLIERFHRHQQGRNPSTRNRGPWWMPYFEIHPTRSAASKRESQIKRKKSSVSIRRLIDQAFPEMMDAGFDP